MTEVTKFPTYIYIPSLSRIKLKNGHLSHLGHCAGIWVTWVTGIEKAPPPLEGRGWSSESGGLVAVGHKRIPSGVEPSVEV